MQVTSLLLPSTSPAFIFRPFPNLFVTSTTSSPPLPGARRPPHAQASTTPFTTFTPAPFTPYPFSNPHFQTVIAYYYPPPPNVAYTRIQLPTDDNAATLQIDLAHGQTLAPTEPHVEHLWHKVPPHSSRSEYDHLPRPPPVAVVLHGLESNARSRISRRIAAAMGGIPMKTVLLNYRSCAEEGEVPTTMRLYHAGFTEDVEMLLRAIKEAAVATGWHPPQVYLCGFSLGANLVCQLLGKWEKKAEEVFGVVAAAAACVPFDPTACQRVLDQGWKGLVYSRWLVNTMHKKFRLAVEAGVDLAGCNIEQMEKADRIGKIDEALVAPVFGFKDKEDYYQKVRRKTDCTSHNVTYLMRRACTINGSLVFICAVLCVFGLPLLCLPRGARCVRLPVFCCFACLYIAMQVDSRKVLKNITVPTLIINARDDPFFDHQSGLSLPTPEQIGDAPITLNITNHGGHCGFLDRQGFERRAPSYFQREFARFFEHVRQSQNISTSSDTIPDRGGAHRPDVDVDLKTQID